MIFLCRGKSAAIDAVGQAAEIHLSSRTQQQPQVVCDSKPACLSFNNRCQKQWRRQKQWIIVANNLWLAEKENS